MNSKEHVLDLDDPEKLLPVLELMLDQAYLGIVFVDPEGIIRFMNRQYEELIGVDRKEAYGKHITEYFPDSRLPVVLQTREAELGWKYHYQGRETLVVNRIPIMRGNQFIGAMTQCIFKDISDLREMAYKLNLLEIKVQRYRKASSDLLTPKYYIEDIKGVSEAITRVKNMALVYARTENTILITGETGTGKELFAHSIHHTSARGDGPFVCINCASIPDELLESELFGYAPGAFTGAQRGGKPGKIELADRGTLFLDEIGELPFRAQAKLLRVLDEKRVERIGEVLPVEVDFRLIAATNRDLPSLMEKGLFRQDLFYRLSTIRIEIPPLRSRTEDIPVLVNHFLQDSSFRGMKITDNALHALMTYSWPGNIRELRNALELSTCLVSKGEPIRTIHLSPHITPEAPNVCHNPDADSVNLKTRNKDIEVQSIKKALTLCRGNKSGAARLLGISRSSLYNKFRQYSLSVPR